MFKLNFVLLAGSNSTRSQQSVLNLCISLSLPRMPRNGHFQNVSKCVGRFPMRMVYKIAGRTIRYPHALSSNNLRLCHCNWPALALALWFAPVLHLFNLIDSGDGSDN